MGLFVRMGRRKSRFNEIRVLIAKIDVSLTNTNEFYTITSGKYLKRGKTVPDVNDADEQIKMTQKLSVTLVNRPL